MSRIQTKMANRLDKNLGSRLRVTMHIPKDPAKINWEKAFETFESVRKRYNINLSKPGKKFEERKKLKGLQMDLRWFASFNILSLLFIGNFGISCNVNGTVNQQKKSSLHNHFS